MRQELFNPARADELYYNGNGYIHKSGERHADNQSPITEVAGCGCTQRAEEGEGRAEEHRALKAREQQVHYRAQTCAEERRSRVAGKVRDVLDALVLVLNRRAADENRDEQRRRHNRNHLLEGEDEVLAERRSLMYIVH